MGYDTNDKASGDDQGMAQTDRAGYRVDIESMTGGKYKDITDGGTSQVGNPQSIDSTSEVPKV